MNPIVFKGVIIRGVCFFKHNNIFLYIKKIQDVSQFVNFANDLITRAFVRINESNVITLYKNRCIDNLKLYFFFFSFFHFFFKHAFIVHVTCFLSLEWIKMENFIISCFYAEVKSLVSWVRTILKIEAWSRDGLECLVVADLPPFPIDRIVCSTWSEQGSRTEYIVINVTNNDTITMK